MTRYVVANGTKLAYRQLGLTSGIPLVMLMHFRYDDFVSIRSATRGSPKLVIQVADTSSVLLKNTDRDNSRSGNMDFWDPALIYALAKSRPIVLLDNAGVGKSEGEIPTTLHGWAIHVIALLDALNIHQIDLLGFSMGGGAAQHVALAAPEKVRKLILAGTRTSRTPNTVLGPRKIFYELAHSETEEEFKAAFALSFFNPSQHGKDAAEASWNRIFTRKDDRAPHLSPVLAKRQTEAFSNFSVSSPENPYERIHELRMPVFVANGDQDLLIPTPNSFELAQLLPHAHLHIYPNSGHGFLYQ